MSHLSHLLSQSKSEGRVFAIEAAKFVAAYCVALIHLAPCTAKAELITNVLRLFPVYYFYASAVHFTIRRVLRRDGSVSAGLSWNRLIRPYAAWTVLYLLLRCAKNGGISSAQGWVEWLGLLFMGQSAVHMYFLPQLVYFQIVAGASALLCANLLKKRFHSAAACWLAAAFVASIFIGRAGYFGWNHTFLAGLVYAFLGAISVCLDDRVGKAWTAVVAPAAFVLIVLSLIAGFGIELPSFYYLLNGPVFGCCTLLVLLRMQAGAPSRWGERLVSCYFGIYLAHHAIEEGLEMIFARLGHSLTPYDVSSRLGFALIAFCGGIMVTLTIRLSPSLACWMLGERRQAECV